MKEQIEGVQRMQDYIGDHLSDSITLADLSQVSFFSPWYSYRLFVQYINMTPADYIRRLRLSKSASPVPLYLFTPYGVKYQKLRRENTMTTVRNVFVQVIEKPARKVLIKRGIKASDYFAYCEEVGCDVWGLLQSIKSISGEPVCMWLTANYITPGTSQYVQGVEVPESYDGVIPNGFDVIHLPAAKYLMFKGEPFAEEDYCQAIEEVQAAIKKYDPAAIDAKLDKTNPRIQLEPIGTRGYMELLPIQ